MPAGGNGGGGGVAFAILGLDDASDTGLSNSDNLTNLSTGFTLTGTIDPSITSFTLFINGDPYTVENIDSTTGDWSYTFIGDPLGDGPVHVRASYTTTNPNSGNEQTTSAKP